MAVRHKADIVVFLGPSLSQDKAKALLPQALILAPVQCGDILRVMRQQPKIIAIIDGMFENTAAVWHKEILYAMGKGIQVYGASSMGALRAAECHTFGMIGVGEIFQQYRQGDLNDDDEVAVSHGPASSGYQVLSHAMVNIRATISEAVTQKLFSYQQADVFLAQAKQLFYRQRTLQRAAALAVEQGVPQAVIENFMRWQESGGYVDVKRRDAEALLQILTANPTPCHEVKEIHSTLYLRTLQKSINCTAPPQQQQHLGEDYSHLKRLAYLLSVMDGLIKTHLPEREHKGVALTQALQQLINYAETRVPDDFVDVDTYLLVLMRLSDDYTKLKQAGAVQGSAAMLQNFKLQHPQRCHLLAITAQLWRVLDIFAINEQLEPTAETVQQQSNKFRLNKQLLEPQQLMQWLDENDLDLDFYQQIMVSLSRFEFLVMKNNLDALGIAVYDSQRDWLSVAKEYANT